MLEKRLDALLKPFVRILSERNAPAIKSNHSMVDSKKYTLDEISQAVGLNGRKYKTFQTVCREMGIKKGA